MSGVQRGEEVLQPRRENIRPGEVSHAGQGTVLPPGMLAVSENPTVLDVVMMAEPDSPNEYSSAPIKAPSPLKGVSA